MKLQQINKTLMAAIPAQICRAKGWKKGTDLKCEIDNKGRVVLWA